MSAPRSTDEAVRYGEGILVGARVRLRPLREDDLARIDAWWQDPEQQALQQGAIRPRPAGTNTDLFRRWSANEGRAGAGFSVEALEDGALVGHVTLWGATLPERDAHVAIMLAPDRVGHGLGSDAMRVLVRWAFLVLGLNRVQLEVFAHNDRARRAYARAGFVEEGVRREAAFIGGAFADEVVMSVLRADWAGDPG